MKGSFRQRGMVSPEGSYLMLLSSYACVEFSSLRNWIRVARWGYVKLNGEDDTFF